MSLQLMKERMRITGHTPREEMIRDGQNLLKEELEHDSSYSPTMFFYNSINLSDDRGANLRVYGRKYSSLNGNYMKFLTTYDNPVKIGEYIHDTKDDTYWLVYNSFNVNDIEYSGKLIQCNYLLKWQLSDGSIIERWANIVSASKYDVGESGNSTIVLSSNNYTILIGYCEEGLDLDGQRVFIDRRTVNPNKVFKITRSDDILFDSGNIGSLLSFIADKSEINLTTDRPDLRLCDYIDTSLSPTPPSDDDETTTINVTISGNDKLKINYPRIYSANITDKNGNVVEWNDTFSWHVLSDFEVNKTISQNNIELSVSDENLIGSLFSIQVINTTDNSIMAEKDITVTAFI